MRSDPGGVLNTKDGSSGPWEKFRMQEIVENGQTVLAIKSLFNKYVTCEANGAGTTKNTVIGPNSKWELVKIATDKIVWKNINHKKYLRIVGNDIKCDTAKEAEATVWASYLLKK